MGEYYTVLSAINSNLKDISKSLNKIAKNTSSKEAKKENNDESKDTAPNSTIHHQCELDTIHGIRIIDTIRSIGKYETAVISGNGVYISISPINDKFVCAAVLAYNKRTEQESRWFLEGYGAMKEDGAYTIGIKSLVRGMIDRGLNIEDRHNKPNKPIDYMRCVNAVVDAYKNVINNLTATGSCIFQNETIYVSIVYQQEDTLGVIAPGPKHEESLRFLFELGAVEACDQKYPAQVLHVNKERFIIAAISNALIFEGGY